MGCVVDFTREPIIETVIFSREGFKLSVKNSCQNSEEYLVDSVEVVSFGGTCFFRYKDKSKSFLFPILCYEIVEIREPKLLIKSPIPLDKSIKIGQDKSGNNLSKRNDLQENCSEKPEFIENVTVSSNGKGKESSSYRKRKRNLRHVKGLKKPVVEEISSKLDDDNENKELTLMNSLLKPPDMLISEMLQSQKRESFQDGDSNYQRNDNQASIHAHFSDDDHVDSLKQEEITEVASFDFYQETKKKGSDVNPFSIEKDIFNSIVDDRRNDQGPIEGDD